MAEIRSAMNDTHVSQERWESIFDKRIVSSAAECQSSKLSTGVRVPDDAPPPPPTAPDPGMGQGVRCGNVEWAAMYFMLAVAITLFIIGIIIG